MAGLVLIYVLYETRTLVESCECVGKSCGRSIFDFDFDCSHVGTLTIIRFRFRFMVPTILVIVLEGSCDWARDFNI